MKVSGKARFVLYGLGVAVVLAVGIWGLISSRAGDGVLLMSGATEGQGQGEKAGSDAGSASWSLPETTSTTVPQIYVQLSGEVRNPGVHALPKGSRLFQALEVAGGLGPEADTDLLSLAAVVADGAHIHVPRKGETATAVSPSAQMGGQVGSGQSTGPVSLGTATAEQLDTLPGIGPALAAAIIAYREEHGGFSSVEELDNVSGIGPALLAKLRDLVVP